MTWNPAVCISDLSFNRSNADFMRATCSNLVVNSLRSMIGLNPPMHLTVQGTEVYSFMNSLAHTQFLFKLP